jgi:outer membrane lipoprotein carrier protein
MSLRVLFLICFFTAHASAAPQKTSLPPLLKEVEAKYTKAATLFAKFAQTKEIASLKMKKQSSGDLWVKRPDKFRWQTLEPDPNILVSDGKTYWFYTPPFDEDERGQLIIRKSSQVQSKLLTALLSGAFSTTKDLTVTKKGEADFLLTPKPGTAGDVLKATVTISPTDKTITRVVLDHKGGNRSEISLTEIHLGPPAEDALFKFDPPTQTEVHKE